MKSLVGAALAIALGAGMATAQPGQGPVVSACADDIAKLCAGKTHENREIRNCLEENKAKVTAACKTALDTTGGGKGQGQGKAKAN